MFRGNNPEGYRPYSESLMDMKIGVTHPIDESDQTKFEAINLEERLKLKKTETKRHFFLFQIIKKLFGK